MDILRPYLRPAPARRARPCAGIRGFSLVELLAVVAIIALMLALMTPAISGFVNQGGRKGAVSLVLSTFEQARVAALETGANVYVGIAGRDFPDAAMRYRAFIVFRDRLADEPGSGNFTYLTGWKALPRGVSFKSEENSVVNRAGGSVTVGPADRFPRLPAGAEVAVVMFNGSGAIELPHSQQYLRLFLYEGYFDGTRDVLTRQSGGLFDRFEFGRFTGRVRLALDGTGA